MVLVLLLLFEVTLEQRRNGRSRWRRRICGSMVEWGLGGD